MVAAKMSGKLLLSSTHSEIKSKRIYAVSHCKAYAYAEALFQPYKPNLEHYFVQPTAPKASQAKGSQLAVSRNAELANGRLALLSASREPWPLMVQTCHALSVCLFVPPEHRILQASALRQCAATFSTDSTATSAQRPTRRSQTAHAVLCLPAHGSRPGPVNA